MYLSHFTVNYPHDLARLRELVNRAELDVVQVDIGEIPHAQHTSDLIDLVAVIKEIHPALFLHPQLRVVVKISGAAIFGSMELLASFLVEHGSSDFLIAAVRSDDLCSSLNELDASFKRREILSARVEIGAGPLSTAFVEGARIVVSNNYDTTAPFIAAGVSEGLCGWGDLKELAALAAASQFVEVAVEATAKPSVEVEPRAVEQLERVRSLGRVNHADLGCDYEEVTLTSTIHGMHRLEGAAALPATDEWNMKVRLSNGCQTAMLIEVRDQERLRAVMSDELNVGKATCQILQTESEIAENRQLFARVEYRDASFVLCREFVERIQSQLLLEPAVGQIVSPGPSITQLTETQSLAIPRDRLTVSVDTRPAIEWL